MVGFKHTLCALLLTMVTGVALAQNNTNSPYTRYGYGDLSEQSFGNSKAMGGIAFGLRDGTQINPLNPASYTAIDSLTFLLEGGVSLQNMNISGSGAKLNAKNSSFDYVAMQFRLHRRVAMSIGLLPFSNVGYNVQENNEATEGVPYSTKSITGDGGLHQLYVGAGVKVLKNFSLGVNVSYFWGDINRTLTMLYPNTASANSFIWQTAVSVSDYKLDFGVQYTQPLSKKHSVTIGAVYSPKHTLNNDYVTNMTSGSVGNATLELPDMFGGGLTYNYDKRLTIGVDYSLQKWSKAKFSLETTNNAISQEFEDTYAYCDRQKISAGAEYIPNLIGRSYLSRIKYRLGAYYMTPYYKIKGKKAAREYGVTAGFGLPVPRSRSILSVGGQIVRVSGQDATFVNENIFRVSIGLTFNEGWFFKRKVE